MGLLKAVPRHFVHFGCSDKRGGTCSNKRRSSLPQFHGAHSRINRSGGPPTPGLGIQSPNSSPARARGNDFSLLVGIHGSEGIDGSRFVRLQVIDFRLEFDLPRFHPLRLSYSKEHYHCAQDGPQEKSSTLLGPLWRLHFWRAVKSWSVRRIALCRPSCRTKTTKSCVQNSDSSSTERFLLVVINLVL